MNSVHEPGSRTMSKNRLRNSTESNRAKNKLSAPSAQPIGPAARPGRAPCRAPRLPAARPCQPAPKRPRAQPPRAMHRAPMLPARPPAACSRAPTALLRPSAQPSARLPYAQWAVAHFRFCILFFFPFFFHFFQPLENTKNSTTLELVLWNFITQTLGENPKNPT